MTPTQRPPADAANPSATSADFASAAMVRVLAQGMRELGLNPTAVLASSADRRATIPLDDKRRLVRAAIEQGGWGCLPLLGRGLHRHAQEPTHIALTIARDVPDLLLRWSRLEQYIHSRHRVDVLAVTDGSAALAHRARVGLPPPLLAESLVVLGVLAALFEAIGAQRVTAWVGDVPAYPQPDASGLRTMAQLQAADSLPWRLSWEPAASRVGTPAEHPQLRRASTPPLEPPQAWPPVAQRCFSTLCKDLMAPPPLPDLARVHGDAPRSLQRHLQQAGLSYTRVLSEARCRSASWWLMHTTTPIAEVGFVSGYSDQPHFTRDFRQRVGLTPLRFRSEFATAQHAC